MQTIRRGRLEATVLDALRERLMDPGLFKAFADSFTAEWNQQQREAASEQTARRAGLERVRQKIGRLVDALADGVSADAVRGRLTALEQERLAMEAEEEAAAAPAPRLHPGLAGIYRETAAGRKRCAAPTWLFWG